MSNPRTVKDADFRYYLVNRAMRLRYPPQYAVYKTDSLARAIFHAWWIKTRRDQWNVYNARGERVFGKSNGFN